MEKQYFKCYELFHKIWKELPQELQAKYYVALMEYGLYWVEPTDPVIKSLMQWPMFSIDKSEEISATKSEYMKGNQNAKKDRDKLGNHIKTEKNRDIQTQTEKNTWSNKEVIRSNKEVIEDIWSNKKNINKKVYLDFVYLAPEEHEKLVAQLWEGLTNDLIEKLNNYIWSTWKKYKSHYFTILNRAKKEQPHASNNELMKERERARIRQEAQEILNRNNSLNGETQNQTANRRGDFSCY